MFPEWLSAEQAAQLEAHFELLTRWNRTLNLTRIRDRAEAIERHYNESLFLAQHLPAAGEGVPLRIVDIGSGAGFPGFPVGIARPDCSMTLVESHQRKAVFLKEASRKLPRIRVLAQRAEDVTEGFDWAISRAVSYEDLGKVLGRLAGHAALLTGGEVPPASLGFEWDEPIPLPGSEQRFLRVGHWSVSRETV